MHVNKDQRPKARPVKVLAIILMMTVCGYLLMIWISPESKNLSAFLVGFAVTFILIVLIAFYIKYIGDLFAEIKKRK
jgi:uncharacterized membrane protein